MAKIKELLHIQGSYSTQVDLKKEFNDPILKQERMAHYKPISAHRNAFQIIAEGAYIKDSKRCYILSGSYGTGKSHLLLMAASYFDSQSDTKEMTEFFNNYTESEGNESEKKAEILKKVRKEGRYLVCICDYGASNLESYILRAIKDALQREGIAEEEMDSYYLQAINKINEWKTSEESYFYDRLVQGLENKNWTINKLIHELSEYNKESIDLFKDLHKKITTSDFEYDKDNYVQIIEQLAKTKKIKEKFSGIVILFDEFDYQLKGKRFDLDEFQKFAQRCAASFMSNFPIIFIATTHRSFASYRSEYNADDFLTVNDRVREIPLETQGIEEIISAVVNPQKKSALWESEIKPRISTFNQLSNECTTLNIFNWLPAPKVRTRIIENIYPMHPMATFSLLKLASDVGSNNRSIFTFFANKGNDSGSYDWFIRNHDITNASSELQFYTVAYLFDYFKDKINSDNQELRQTVKEHVRNFEASLRELSKHRSNNESIELQDILYDRILKVMVIYQIIGININEKMLMFGLNMNTQTKEKELTYCLNVACTNKIIYYNETNYCYEFKRSDALDIAGIISEYKKNKDNIPKDIILEVEQVLKHDEIKKIKKFFKDEYYFEAARYNYAYKEDKRLLRKFCTVRDIENTAYHKKLLYEIEEEKDIKKSCEGIALYVICETEDDIKRARILARNNLSNRIIIGIPVEENPIYDDVFSLKAAFNIDQTDFSQQDLGFLKERIQYYDTNLANKLYQYITGKNLIYYGEKGTELANASNENDTAATKLFEMIYEGKRNKINHEDLNKLHTFKEASNFALRDAVEILLNLNSPVSFRKDYGADRGDIRYLQNVLFQYGVIKQEQTIGNHVICKVEQDTSKYLMVFPALSAMIDEIKDFDKHVLPHGLVNNYMQTFGIGYNAAILFFAVAKRYYKDSLIIMPDANDIGSLKITSYDAVLDLLYNHKYRNAVMEYRQILRHDEFLLRELYVLLSNKNLGVDTTITIDQLHELLKSWYEGLPTINRVKSIYDNKDMNLFIDVFNNLDRISVRDFIFEEIKTIYGYDRQDLLLEDAVPELISRFKIHKELAEQGYYIVRERLINEIKEIFNAKELTFSGISDAINLWLVGLTDVQRSYTNSLHVEESKYLIMHLGKTTDIEELFMNTLPSAYKLGSVKTWVINKCDSFIQKIKVGKNHVEHNLFTVKPPKYKLDGKDIVKSAINDTNVQVSYTGELQIDIIPDVDHQIVYITSNGQDPKDISAQREERSDVFTYTTKEDKNIRFCGVDSDGKSSAVISLELLNEENKYVAKIVEKHAQIKLGQQPREEYQIQVILPKDKESMTKCIRSIIAQTKTKYNLNETDCKKVLESLLNEMGE